MEQVCQRKYYDTWRQAERALRETRDRRMVVTLPKVTIQQTVGEAPPREEDLDVQ